jgi:hypothetical protein
MSYLSEDNAYTSAEKGTQLVKRTLSFCLLAIWYRHDGVETMIVMCTEHAR